MQVEIHQFSCERYGKRLKDERHFFQTLNAFKKIQWQLELGLQLLSAYHAKTSRSRPRAHARLTQAVHLQVIFWLFSVLTARFRSRHNDAPRTRLTDDNASESYEA